MLRIGWSTWEQLSPSLLKSLHRELPYKKQLLLRQPGPGGGIPSAAGLLLLKWLLRRSGHPEFHFSQLRFPRKGKPFCLLPVDFSISHSGGVVMCAVSSCSSVGIDVEEAAAPGPGGPEGALTARDWTRLEATLKAEGRSTLGEWRQVRLMGERSYFRGRLWYLRAIPCPPGYVAHLATDRPLTTPPLVEELSCGRLE